MNEQFRRRSVGAPAARTVLLTILGEFVLPRRGAVWRETLVAALMAMGYSAQAARQAIARSVRDGWLISVRDRRRTRMSLSPATSALLDSGTERIYSFGSDGAWDGRWLVVVLRVPEAQRDVRHQLRTRLAWAGLGSIGGGVWITPRTEREAEIIEIVSADGPAEVVAFRGELAALGEPSKVARAAWELDAVRAEYERFLKEFSRMKGTTPELCFTYQTALVDAWRRFPLMDPDLPVELLPAKWPRHRAQALFHDRHDRWEAKARSYFEALEDKVSTLAAV